MEFDATSYSRDLKEAEAKYRDHIDAILSEGWGLFRGYPDGPPIIRRVGNRFDSDVAAAVHVLTDEAGSYLEMMARAAWPERMLRDRVVEQAVQRRGQRMRM